MLPDHSKINTFKYTDGSNLDILSIYLDENECALGPLNHPSGGNIQW